MRLLRSILGALTILLAGSAAVSCSERPVATPRERAYPRPRLYPTEYTTVRTFTSAPGDLLVNDSARIVIHAENPNWVDILYPAYGITVNCTLTPYSPDAIANRNERIQRNLRGHRAEVAGFQRGIMVVSPQTLGTPVQFLATDSATWVLSGTAVSNFAPGTPPDSVEPLIDAVAVDIALMINNL